jgi:hypothetical protein
MKANPQTPVVTTPLPADGVRPTTEAEHRFYKVMYQHYLEKCLRNPCDRGLRSQMKAYKEIVESRQVGTMLGPLHVSDVD